MSFHRRWQIWERVIGRFVMNILATIDQTGIIKAVQIKGLEVGLRT